MIAVQVENGKRLLLRGEATVQHVNELHAQLSECLKHQQVPEALDLSELTALDTAGAQVLIAFKRVLPALAVQSCPAPIRAFAERAGLEALLF